MAFYVDEERVWKCAKHPSKRRRTGICPDCLRDKLASLCPDCACSATSSSSSISSSTYSCFSTAHDVSCFGGVDRVSKLVETEPAFRRSRSLAIPFLRLKPESLTEKNYSSASDNKNKTPSILSMFRCSSTNTSKRYDSGDGMREVEKENKSAADGERTMMMRKSRSVAMKSHYGTGDSKLTKGKFTTRARLMF